MVNVRHYQKSQVQVGGAPVPSLVAIDIQVEKPGYVRALSVWKDSDTDLQDCAVWAYITHGPYQGFFWRIPGHEVIGGEAMGGPNKASWFGKVPVDSTMHFLAIILPAVNDESFVLEAIVDED